MDAYDHKYARLKDAIDTAVAETDFQANAEMMNKNPKADFLLRKQFHGLVKEKLEKDPRCFYCEGSSNIVERVWMQHTWAALHVLWAAT